MPEESLSEEQTEQFKGKIANILGLDVSAVRLHREGRATPQGTPRNRAFANSVSLAASASDLVGTSPYLKLWREFET